MSGKWETAKLSDFKEVTYKYEKHNPQKLNKRYPWLVCKSCGLVFLKNKATRKAIKLGCYYSYKK